MTPYYLTTPIYYVNDKPHIGHAYTTLACDVLARFKRLDGFDVKFLTGTDEHGQKVQAAAEKAGISPQQFTDTVSQNFRDLLGVMNFSTDQFIRTTEPRHYEACQALWQRLMDKGHITLGKYEGWYSVRDEAFLRKQNWLTARLQLVRLWNGLKSRPIFSICLPGNSPCLTIIRLTLTLLPLTQSVRK